MNYNKIYSEKEYRAQGFTTKEIPMIIAHDMLYNKWVDANLTETENMALHFFADELGL